MKTTEMMVYFTTNEINIVRKNQNRMKKKIANPNIAKKIKKKNFKIFRQASDNKEEEQEKKC